MQSEISLKKPETTPKIVYFGNFSFDPVDSALCEEGVAISIRPQASRALTLLISRAGEIVSHQELCAEIWGNKAVSWKDGLHQIIRDLRKALSDDPKTPVYIETINRRGYRFHLKPKLRSRPHALTPVAPSKARDAVVFGAGVLAFPALVVVACVALGMAA